jgi:L-histidine N-alpha-methyltransferase
MLPARDRTPLESEPCVDETLILDRSPLIDGLGTMLQKADFAWSLSLIGEDQGPKLATLTADLRRRFSNTGAGKRITSGFLYLGAEPALAWANACRDHQHPMMKQSIESFDQRWSSIRSALEKKPYHYVSLGPGDGQKDAVIIRDLRRDNAKLSYVAVDMSTEMLRLGANTLTRQLKLPRSRILSVQLDFSSPNNVVELKHLLDGLFNEEAILFSLLGNTVANFEDDTELLRMLAEQLLRTQDKFILEVATTQRLNDALAQGAAEEYEHSRTFCEFATSALMHSTDLQIDMDSLLFEGRVEGERALLMNIIYHNKTGRDIRMTLPDRTSVRFPNEDTIHLCISRKYARHYLDSLLAKSGVHEAAGSHLYFDSTHHNDQFGMDLLLLTLAPKTAPPVQSIAERIWEK